MRAKKQCNYSKPYSSNINNKIKAKKVGRRMQTQDNMPMCYQRGNRRTR